MKSFNLDQMKKGWFVGDFVPTVLRDKNVEVACKKYAKGDKESSHYHAIATEITLVVTGKVKMFDREWNSGDIILIEPNEATSFEALTDSCTVVVKVPSVTNDKFNI